jgi:hypothetical protein
MYPHPLDGNALGTTHKEANTMLTKKEFIESGLKEVPTNPADQERARAFWSTQYDLYMSGVRGADLHDHTCNIPWL